MKKLKIFIPTLLLLFALQSCSESTEVVESKTITDLAAATPTLSSLTAALQKVNLDETLKGNGPFTVLAPTNEAFSAFLAANNFNSLQEVPNALLREVLLNHVISGSLKSTDLSTGYANTMATSEASNTNMSLYIDTSDGVKFNGISSVDQANIEADNGVIHIVDKVIGLPTVVDFALADPNFSTLVSALTRNDLTTDFVATLSAPNGTAPAPFTVFAPINEAFTAVLAELSLTMLSEIDEPTLKSTLNYHVIAGTNALDSSLSDGMTLTTLGGDITANVTGGATLTDGNNRVIDIIATNVQANNGVIHAINKVILPK